MVCPTWLHNLRDYSAKENLEIVMNKASEARLPLRSIPVMENVFYVTVEMAKYWRANVESKGKTVQCSFQNTTGESLAVAGLMP